MKRPFVAALIIGALIAGAIGALHATHLLTVMENPVQQYLSTHQTISQVIGETWLYVMMSILAIGVAWLTLATSRRGRVGWLVLALLIELAGFAWICGLYHIFLQPLPLMIVAVLAFIISERFFALYRRTSSSIARDLLGDRVSKEELQRVIDGEVPFDAEPRTFDTTVVVCDIANKYELADENAPGIYAETTEAFIQRATAHFLEAGAYIQAADGEGVVALFGFPGGEPNHADKAVRMTLGLADVFRDFQLANTNGESPPAKCDVHVGVSSGTMIAAPFRRGERPSLLTSGEPVELARRFCVANRFYGSRILIGPRTFELASRHIVARPIDFLSGVNSQERHEIFEPLCLATEAKPESIARRDSFWNGVVLYREKRWAEAYQEFQKARGPADAEEDAPLQLYLRRLEVLALHLAEAPEMK